MKLLKALFLSLMVMTITLHSRPSQAAVGALVAAPAIVTGGLVIAGGAAAVQVVATIIDSGPGEMSGFMAFLLLFITVPVAVFGLVVLDSEQSVEFAPLTKELAKDLNITSGELKAYHAELDQLNSLAAFVDEEIAKDGKATLEESVSMWNEVKTSVSPEAFSALVKVNKQLFQQ